MQLENSTRISLSAIIQLAPSQSLLWVCSRILTWVLLLYLSRDDVAGLEVLKGGDWVTVQPLSHAIVVILADQTEVITNGEYKSAIHRAVTNANRARLSVATFHDPAKTRKIAPAPELVEKSAPKYQEVLYGEFVKSWYTKGPDGKRNLDALLL